MIYTTCILTTKAVVEGMISKAGLAGNSCEAPLPAAFVSGRGSGIRASATAGRAERRASAATGGATRVRGQRRVGAPLRLVHRLGRWAQPLGRPYLRLNAKPPGPCDRRQQPGLVFFPAGDRAREPRKRLAQQPACQRWRCYAHSPCGLPSRRCVATLAQRPHRAPRPRLARSAPPTARTSPSRTFAARRMPMPLCARRRWPSAPTRPRACSRPTSRRSRTRR